MTPRTSGCGRPTSPWSSWAIPGRSTRVPREPAADRAIPCPRGAGAGGELPLARARLRLLTSGSAGSGRDPLRPGRAPDLAAAPRPPGGAVATGSSTPRASRRGAMSEGSVGVGSLERHRAGLLVTIGFLLWSLVVLRDYGQVWDEPETRDVAFLNLHVLKAVVTHQPRPEWAYHELTGYYFTFDTIRGVFAWVVSRRLHLLDDILAFHLFNVLLSTLSIFLLYHLALAVSGQRRIAVLSAAVLALFPQFLAHAQTNPKDLPGLFVYILSILAFVRLDRTSGWREVLASGLALGLALTTTVPAVFLFPLLGLWLVITRWPLLKERWRSYLLLPVIAGVTAFLSWPWLWRHPVHKVAWVIARLRTFRTDLMGEGGVLYLGSVYKPWALPWHYFIVTFLDTTPVLFLVFALASCTRLRPPRERTAGSPWAAAVLGWVWCIILAAAEARAARRYDGIRPVLMLVPGFCLLAGIGLDRILGWIEGARAGEPLRVWRHRGATVAAAPPVRAGGGRAGRGAADPDASL